jgi:hypothetical protein
VIRARSQREDEESNEPAPEALEKISDDFLGP